MRNFNNWTKSVLISELWNNLCFIIKKFFLKRMFFHSMCCSSDIKSHYCVLANVQMYSTFYKPCSYVLTQVLFQSCK